MRQMAAADLPYRGGPITAVFLTHLHSDHTLGLPDVILTSWVMGRQRPLTVVGPPGTREMTDHLEHARWEQVKRETAEIRKPAARHR